MYHHLAVTPRIAALQEEAEKIIDGFVTELGLYQNVMVKSLEKKAAKLQIQAEPVKVDRSRIPEMTRHPKPGDDPRS